MSRVRIVVVPVAVAITLLLAAAAAKAEPFYPPPASVRADICAAFGRYCDQAVKVAWCEGRYKTYAQNGQYLGTFQMGSSERRRYGHSSTVRGQDAAAARYFFASGADWSPWECKPW